MEAQITKIAAGKRSNKLLLKRDVILIWGIGVENIVMLINLIFQISAEDNFQTYDLDVSKKLKIEIHRIE